MAWKKTVVLRDGRKVLLRDLSPKDSASELRAFIASFVKEGAFISRDEVPSMKEQKEWLKGQFGKMKKGEAIQIIAESGGRIVGKASAARESRKERNNVELGIAVLPTFRGASLGKLMLQNVIARVKTEMKPKNIALAVLEPNKRAHALYRKVGFRDFARFPNWLLHEGKYYDKIYLILR